MRESSNKQIKKKLRNALIYLHIDLSKNLKYDRLTRLIMKKTLKENSNCIDIGAHKGEILDDILTFSPQGQHYAFEPIPYLYNNLKANYSPRVKVYPYALAEREGVSTFQVVENAPAYSGIKQRNYDDIKKPRIKEITVATNTLDGTIGQDVKIDFIKIDIEGGEYHALLGGKDMLIKNKPTIIFECGNGASEQYGTDYHGIYDYLTEEIGLKIYTLSAFIKKQKPLSKVTFAAFYITGDEYYFVASK
ncbi:MAG: methyltransferase FkbM family [Bacteroidetes bacterium]|nr:methyltransferase FkbM family [Bacteroidota bacterium]